MPFISISIDICNSTRSKLNLSNHAVTNDSNISYAYKEFQEKMFEIEHTFIDLAINNRLNIKRLFLLKIIGDELWYAYRLHDMDLNEKRTAINTMMQILTQLNTKSFNFAHSNGIIEMPVKTTMDTIANALEISEMRSHHQRSAIKKLLTPVTKFLKVTNEESIEKIYKQLTTASHDRTYGDNRPDYIGFEIDRFFKLAEKTKNNMLLLGPNIMKLLNVKTDEEHQNSYNSKQNFLANAGIQKESFQFSEIIIPAHEMKGITMDSRIGLIQSIVIQKETITPAQNNLPTEQ